MLTLKNVTLRRGTKLVLNDVTFALNPGEKASLVGRNGAGKSSLFGLLNGSLQVDAGDVHWPPRWQVAEVLQNMPETEDSATDYVLQGDIPLMRAEQALAEAEASGDGEAMAHAHAALAEAGSFDARPRAQALLMGLGFKTDQLDAAVNHFSGGWRMRLQLARALMCPSDLMLLDEPTNHLDLDALVWLESWLQRYEGSLLIISHDREFLDAITKVTLHLDEGKVIRYTGNYTAFEAMRAERMSQQQSAFARQQDKVAHLQKFIDRFKAKASKAKQAQSRVKALERMEKLAPVLASADFNFEFREPLNLPNPMLVMKDVACGYGDTTIVSNVTRTVMPGQRIGILGANGQGKSTLVKSLAGAQPVLSGTVTQGKGLAIGYFAQQEMDVLRPDEGPLAHMIRLARQVSPQAREQELRNFLGNFRFTGEAAMQPVGTCSGGEKARLVLALLVWQRPNLLLLDEPTNHLDLATREALSMALNEYEGSVMLVSHDRALLREVCDEFWLVSKGELTDFDGDLDDYQRWLLDQSREAARALKKSNNAEAKQATAKAAPAPKPAAARLRCRSGGDRKADAAARQKVADQAKPLKAELKQVEARIASAGTERGNTLEQLNRSSLSASERAEQGRRLKQLDDDIEALEMRWLELGELIEQLNAG